MNLINRLLIVLQLLFTVVLMMILILLILFAPQLFVSGMNNLTRGLVEGPNAALTSMICAGLAGVLIVIALLILFLELHRPAARRLKVQEVTGGKVEVTVEAIAHRLELAILQIADVTRVRPHLRATKRGQVVDLFLEAETTPDVNVPQKTQEIIGTARQLMEGEMGLRVGNVKIRLDHSRKGQKQRTDGGRQGKQFPPTEQPEIPN
jgi:hypothetical protein